MSCSTPGVPRHPVENGGLADLHRDNFSDLKSKVNTNPTESLPISLVYSL